jgi:hypothetical protein
MKRLASLLILAFSVTVFAQTAPSYPPPPDNNWAYGPQDNNWDPSWNQRPDPRSGVCFYTHSSYSGNHFCVRVGDRLPALPSHFGDHVSSIQLFGNARVRLFNDSNYKNGSVVLDHSVDNLADVPFRGGHTWNKRVSSIIVF